MQANIERKLPTDEARLYKIRAQVDTTFNTKENGG
jgi:hypothetical protein